MDITHSILKMSPRPTAIFALNDLMALGALLAAAEAGFSVPRDLAIAGYDDLEIAHFMNPPLTTIAQPKKEIGAQAVNLLVDRLSHKSRPPTRLVLPPELIIRRSTTKEPDQSVASTAPGLSLAVQPTVDLSDPTDAPS